MSTQTPISRTDLQLLAMTRMEDAHALLKGNRFSGAYYLAGYAIELGLKACIAKTITAETIPPKAFINGIYTHDLQQLVAHAGLKPLLDKDLKKNPVLNGNWMQAFQWNEKSRYKNWAEKQARSMVDAIGSDSDGVLQWVKNHW